MNYYIDIDRLRSNDEFGKTNGEGFEIGDKISIHTLIDSSIASIRYNEETDDILCLSKHSTVTEEDTLHGFYDYINDKERHDLLLDYLRYSYEQDIDQVIYGVWLTHNQIEYEEDAYNNWYVCDLFDTVHEHWFSQSAVETLCEQLELTYINTLYSGEFKGWEDVKRYVYHNWKSKDFEKGITLKNLTKLNDSKNREPVYLNIINDSFLRLQKKRKIKNITDDEINAVKSIVTHTKVKEELKRLQKISAIPKNLQPEDMTLISNILPYQMYEYCIKENSKVVGNIEELSKICNKITMDIVREILCR